MASNRSADPRACSRFLAAAAATRMPSLASRGGHRTIQRPRAPPLPAAGTGGGDRALGHGEEGGGGRALRVEATGGEGGAAGPRAGPRGVARC
eukprot:5176172-Prymnesium_polylepis.1